MKRLYFSMMLCALSVGAWAQEDDQVTTIPSHDAWWELEWIGHYKSWLIFSEKQNGEPALWRVYDEGDSIVDGQKYAKIHVYGERQALLLERQEEQRVYLRDEATGQEVLLQDTSIGVGDEVTVSGGVRMRVTEKKTEAGWGNRQTLKLRGVEDESIEDVWSEGVGSLRTGVLPPDWAEGMKEVAVVNVVGDNFVDGFDINTDVYKSKNLEYFDLTEEDWKEWNENGEGRREVLDFEFIGDTLHVTGFLDLNCYNYQIVCTIRDGKIEVAVHELVFLDELDCRVTRKVDAKIPGFQQGTYQISFREQAPVEAVCGSGEIAGYRPFIEDDKEWIVKWSEGDYYYLMHYGFSDDAEYVTVNGKPGVKMVCTYDFSTLDEAGIAHPAVYSEEVGAFYEEGKRVYYAYPSQNTGFLLYDFGAAVGDTIDVYSTQGNAIGAYIVEDKKTEESDCYKGICTQVRKDPGLLAVIYNLTDTWMEGVGGNGAPTENVDYGYLDGVHTVLLACTVGDEVLYKDPEWNLDKTSEGKKRVDFTHVVKIQPKSPQRRTEGTDHDMVSGEYSSKTLTVDLGTLRQSYHVTIADGTGQTVYQKDVRASGVLALNIDISAYADGDYTIVMENDNEIFTGQLSLSGMTPVPDIAAPTPKASLWYDLMGRSVVGRPQRGVYLHEGKKVFVR